MGTGSTIVSSPNSLPLSEESSSQRSMSLSATAALSSSETATSVTVTADPVFNTSLSAVLEGRDAVVSTLLSAFLKGSDAVLKTSLSVLIAGSHSVLSINVMGPLMSYLIGGGMRSGCSFAAGSESKAEGIWRWFIADAMGRLGCLTSGADISIRVVAPSGSDAAVTGNGR
jgi:hypothetical protein